MKNTSNPLTLELIAQPAGWGKTAYCIGEFRKAFFRKDVPLIPDSYYILPNKEHADRVIDLILRKGPKENIPAGLLAPSVGTINEFIRRVARTTAARTPGDVLSKMILRGVLKEEPLSYFRKADETPGFLDLLNDFVTEAKANFLTESEFRKKTSALSRKETVFGKKIADLAAIFRGYEERLGKLGLLAPADFIRDFIREESAREGNRKPFTLVVLDGFYHFSKAQLEFIRELTRLSARVIVTLTMDSGTERTHVFEYPARTRQELRAMGFSEPAWPVRESARTKDASLSFLERNLFREGAPPFRGKAGSVKIFEAASTTNEIEMIAREIRRLYRNGPCHYSDICILLRTIGGYEPVIRATFERFGIPVTVHERKKLKQNALIHSFLKWIRLLKNDWEREDLEAILRSSYFGFSREARGKLLRVSAEKNVHKGKDAWESLLADLPEPAREEITPLFSWHERFAAGKYPEDFKKLLLGLIRDCRMVDRLPRNDETVRDDFAACRALEGVMDEIIFYRGRDQNTPMTFSFYGELLEEAVNLTLYSVKEHDKNRVQVYDVAFAVQKEYKAVFVSGLLERVFPKQIFEDAILKDDERSLLGESGIAFEERFRRIAGERYFFYVAVTRAAERLYLTYPIFDLEGHELLPSFYTEEVKQCLGAENVPVEKQEMGEIVPGPEEACGKKDILKLLTRALFDPEGFRRKDFGLYAYLWNLCVADADYRVIVREILKDGQKAEIRDPEILQWFREHQNGPFSASKLELFATCPFRFFSERVLGLEAERSSLDPRHIGTILHDTLENFFREMTREKNPERWILFTDVRRAKQRISEILDEVLKKKPFYGEKKFRAEIARRNLREILEAFLTAEAGSIPQRKAKPAFFELDFGGTRGEPATIGCLAIGSGDGEIRLWGRMDRIEYDPETNYACVVDYKTGRGKADLLMENLEKGLELQLPIYLMAVRELLGYRPAAGELYPIKAPNERNGVYEKEAMEALGEGHEKSEGLLAKEEFEALLSTVKGLIVKYVGELRSGEIAIRSKGCKFCECNQICRFEKWRLIYSEQEKVWKKPEREK